MRSEHHTNRDQRAQGAVVITAQLKYPGRVGDKRLAEVGKIEEKLLASGILPFGRLVDTPACYPINS